MCYSFFHVISYSFLVQCTGEPSIKSTSSKEEYTDNHGISVVNQIDSIESMGKVCDSGKNISL